MDNYCKTCLHDGVDIGFCDKCYYNHILEEKGIPPTKYEAKPKPITNADRIRAMSDEELAEAFTDVRVITLRLHRIPVAEPVIEQAKEDWLDWLKQEASDGRDD